MSVHSQQIIRRISHELFRWRRHTSYWWIGICPLRLLIIRRKPSITLVICWVTRVRGHYWAHWRYCTVRTAPALNDQANHFHLICLLYTLVKCVFVNIILSTQCLSLQLCIAKYFWWSENVRKGLISHFVRSISFKNATDLFYLLIFFCFVSMSRRQVWLLVWRQEAA